MTAQSIRDFFRTLFGSLRVEELKESLAKTEKERDYFRQRADRLELMLLPIARPAAERKSNAVPVPHRKSWAQIVMENQAEINRKAEAKKAKETN